MMGISESIAQQLTAGGLLTGREQERAFGQQLRKKMNQFRTQLLADARKHQLLEAVPKIICEKIPFTFTEGEYTIDVTQELALATHFAETFFEFPGFAAWANSLTLGDLQTGYQSIFPSRRIQSGVSERNTALLSSCIAAHKLPATTSAAHIAYIASMGNLQPLLHDAIIMSFHRARDTFVYDLIEQGGGQFLMDVALKTVLVWLKKHKLLPPAISKLIPDKSYRQIILNWGEADKKIAQAYWNYKKGATTDAEFFRYIAPDSDWEQAIAQNSYIATWPALVYVQSHACQVPKLCKDIEAAKQNAVKLQELLTRNKEDTRSLRLNNTSLAEQLTQLQGKVKRLEGKGRQDPQQLEGQLKSKTQELANAQEQLRETSRANARLQKAVTAAEDKLVEAAAVQLNLERQLKLQHDLTITGDLGITIEALSNAISMYKVAIFGGEMLFERIAQMPHLENIRLIKGNPQSLKQADFVQFDLFVIITKQISHSLASVPMSMGEHLKIPILRYNGTNLQNLLKEIFSVLYK